MPTMLLRIDDSGSVFLVRDMLTPREADDLRASLEATAHKQTYLTVAYEPQERAATIERHRILE